MSKNIRIECEIVKRAVEATDPEGWAVAIGNLQQQISEVVGLPLTHNEVLDALKRVYEHGYINLRKWDLNRAEHRDYRGKDDDDGVFFFNDTFFIQRTPYSSNYLEQFLPGPEPEKRPIGFKA
jgi:hypothetical protein